MGVVVRIPTLLRSVTNGEAEAMVEGKTVQEVIDNLEITYKGIKERICDENGHLRQFLNLYLNNEEIPFHKNLDTEVGDGVVLSIIPVITGGFGWDGHRSRRSLREFRRVQQSSLEKGD